MCILCKEGVLMVALLRKELSLELGIILVVDCMLLFVVWGIGCTIGIRENKELVDCVILCVVWVMGWTFDIGVDKAPLGQGRHPVTEVLVGLALVENKCGNGKLFS